MRPRPSCTPGWRRPYIAAGAAAALKKSTGDSVHDDAGEVVHRCLSPASNPSSCCISAGGGASAASWANQARRFGHRSPGVQYDRCGHNRSTRGDQPIGVARHADEAAALIDALGIGRRHHGHSRRRCAACRRPPGLLTAVVPPAVSAMCAHVVRPRTRHLSRGLARSVVPPLVPAARRALAKALVFGHAVHGAQRRKRLRGHNVWLRRGRCRFVLPLRSPARHVLDTRSSCR